jgi:GT2 family glycosyltransferase
MSGGPSVRCPPDMAIVAGTGTGVVDVEVTQPIPDVVVDRRDGTTTQWALVLVRCHTEPVGTLAVVVPPDGLRSADLRQAIEARYGEALQRRLPQPSAYLAGRADALRARPAVSVVICSRDRPQALARALHSVQSQSYRASRILVVDSASSDERTRDVARAHGVDCLRVTRPGLSRARNAAVAATAGETVAWLDDDEVADEHWLAEVARALVQTSAEVICGAVLPAELRTPTQVWFEELGGLVKGRGWAEAIFGPGNASSSHPFFPLPPVGAGANMVTRGGVVERVGGFDPALGAGTPARSGEDTLFFAQVRAGGGSIAYRPSALTWHFHRDGESELYQQLRGYGTGLTAMYLALLRRRPGAVWTLLGLAPRALTTLLRPLPVSPTFEVEVPTRLRRAIRRGMVAGPVAYLRGCRPRTGGA